MERAQDLVRSALRAIVAVAKIEGAAQVQIDIYMSSIHITYVCDIVWCGFALAPHPHPRLPTHTHTR